VLAAASLVYEGEPPTLASLEARLERDLERGTTSLGPHLDDVRLVSGERDLRGFGSQGEQRLTVLSLLLAEAALIAERRGVAPLLLLDDVLSELDPARRRTLASIVGGLGQTVITSTEASATGTDSIRLSCSSTFSRSISRALACARATIDAVMSTPIARPSGPDI